MKRYIAILEIDDDCEIVGSIDATVSYTYRENGTNYATTESVEFQELKPVIHAKWEHDNYGHIYCSYCKADSLTTHKSLYCPACGAKMDKEENNLPLCEEVIHGDFMGVMDKE